MDLFKRFAATSFIVLVLLGLSMGYLLTRFLEENHVSRSIEMASRHVAQDIEHKFSEENLIERLADGEKLELSAALDHLNLGDDFPEVTIWSPGLKVLWATNGSIIGASPSGNKMVAQARRGEVVSTRCGEDAVFCLTQSSSGNLLSVFVPVKDPDGKGIAAIFEVREKIHALGDDIGDQLMLVWLANFAGVLILFFALSGIVWKGAKRIDAQNEEITKSENSLRNILRFAHDGIFSFNRQGRIILFNRAAEKLFGYPSGEAKEKNVLTLIDIRSKRDFQDVTTMLFKDIERDTGLMTSMRCRTKAGVEIQVRMALSASGEGEERVITAFAQDV